MKKRFNHLIMIFFILLVAFLNFNFNSTVRAAYDVTIWAWDATDPHGWIAEKITMDGIDTGFKTPHTFIGLTGTHSFKVPDVDINNMPFSRWKSGVINPTIQVSSGGTYTAEYYAPISVTIQAWDATDPAGFISEPITRNGYTSGYTTPHTFTNLIPYHNVFTVPAINSRGTPFKSWSTGETSRSISTNSEGTYIAQYVPKVATPMISPPGGIYSSSQSVTISCSTSGATIRYTLDGSEPSSSSTMYSGSILVSYTITIKAKAFKSGMTDSDTSSSTFSISITSQKVAAPTFSPAGGTYSSTQNVVLSCSTPGATIRYTLDGSEPSALSTVYLNPLSIGSTGTITAKAFKAGMEDSNIASATYTFVSSADSGVNVGLIITVFGIGITIAVAIIAVLFYLKKRR